MLSFLPCIRIIALVKEFQDCNLSTAVIIRRLTIEDSNGSFQLIPFHENWGLQQIQLHLEDLALVEIKLVLTLTGSKTLHIILHKTGMYGMTATNQR